MKIRIKYTIAFQLILFIVSAQNEQSKWYFGNYAGLDFVTNPPTSFSTVINANGNSASISDALGNILFYTDGMTVYNSSHTIMANGTGLAGGNSHYNGMCPLIVKQPGNSNIYYVFTTNASTLSTGGLRYSVIDMNLAAGMGSVTTKNVLILAPPVSYGVSGTKHCNGNDYWIVSHNHGTTYYSFLLNSTGLSTTAVTTTLGASSSLSTISMLIKISPNGKKIIHGFGPLASGASRAIDLCDFDNSTGLVSNYNQLRNTYSGGYSLWAEFSSDCSKIYVTEQAGSYNPITFVNNDFRLFQYDLCANTFTQMQNSIILISNQVVNGYFANMQLASNGKIYIAKYLQPEIAVINNPNLIGTACNFVSLGPSLVNGATSSFGLVNQINYFQKPPIAPIGFTINTTPCQNVNFNSPLIPGTSFGTCPVNTYTLQSLQWDFGDPFSLSNNTSTLSSPSHTYTTIGTYTVRLILNFGCGGGIDTLKQVININQSCFSVSTTSITCSNLGSATVTSQNSSASLSYSWLPTSQTNSVAFNLQPGTYTLLVHDLGINFTHTLFQQFNPLIPLTGNVSNSNSITCNGASTGTGAITSISGGSSQQFFSWFNGTTTFSTSTTNSLSAGLWTVTVSDALTACSFSNAIFITQPPPSTLNLSASSPSACAGFSISLNGTNAGGTPFSTGPPYTYSWSSATTGSTSTVSQTLAGNYVYTLNSSDANNCVSTNTIAVDFIANPTLTANSIFVCPLAIGTLTVSGATNYTWTSASTTLSLPGSTFTDAPSSSQQYTVIGEALGCTSQIHPSMILHNLPNPVLNINTTLCNGANINMIGFGGTSYQWSGPNSFSSFTQSNSIVAASLANAGVYNLTVTAVTGCTASTSQTVTVNPTPTLSVNGSTVCSSQTLNLSASSFIGSTFLWTGPLSFTSNSQNPSIVSPSVTHSGTYSVQVTSADGCIQTGTALATVVPPPSLSAQLTSNTLCSQAFNGSPNTITLTAGGASMYTLVTVPDMSSSNPSLPVTQLTSIPPYTGIATATLTGSNGVCTATTGLTFTIVPNPTVSVNSPTPVICAGQSFTYTSQGATSYTWSNNTPGITTYSTGQIAVANPSVNSVFAVYGGSLGCFSPIRTTTITVNPLPKFVMAPLDPTICLNSSTILNANGDATTYSWSPNINLSSMTGNTVSASPQTHQTYTVIGSLNSCTSSAFITVSVVPLPSPTATALKPELCLKEIITLIGQGGKEYTWYGPSDLMYAGQTVSFVASSPFMTGTYTLHVKDENGCTASNKLNIKVNNLPSADLLISQKSGCVPFTSYFKFNVHGQTNHNIDAYWQLEDQTFTDKQFFYHFSEPKTYSIIAYYTDTLTSCKNTQSFIVEAYPLPIADYYFEPAHPVEGLDEVYFVNNSQGENLKKFNWHFINNQGYRSDAKNTSYLFNELGEYAVALQVENTWGCKDTIVKAIQIEADYNFYIPNTFTPNDDNLNDIFTANVRGVKLYQLRIFDRWSKLIFQTNDPQQGWDGYYNAQPAKQDSYIWKVVLSTNSGEEKVYTGQVLLTR